METFVDPDRVEPVQTDPEHAAEVPGGSSSRGAADLGPVPLRRVLTPA